MRQLKNSARPNQNHPFFFSVLSAWWCWIDRLLTGVKNRHWRTDGLVWPEMGWRSWANPYYNIISVWFEKKEACIFLTHIWILLGSIRAGCPGPRFNSTLISCALLHYTNLHSAVCVLCVVCTLVMQTTCPASTEVQNKASKFSTVLLKYTLWERGKKLLLVMESGQMLIGTALSW